MRLADGCTWDTRAHTPVDMIEAGAGPRDEIWDLGNWDVYPPEHGPCISMHATEMEQ